MTTKYGELAGRLTLTIAGNDIDLGSVHVPLTGFYDRGAVRLHIDTTAVGNAVRELFARSTPPEVEASDEGDPS